jgi:hypothetical protein
VDAEAAVLQQLAEGKAQVIHGADWQKTIEGPPKSQNPNTKLQRNPKWQIPKPAAG